MELPHFTAEGVDAGNAGHGPQDRAKDPVLEGPQFHQTPGRTLQRVLEDLTEPRRDRTEIGHDTVGQVVADGEQPLQHQLAGEIDVRTVLEDDGDHRQAEL